MKVRIQTYYELFILVFLITAIPSKGFSQNPGPDTCRIVFGWSESGSSKVLLDWMKNGKFTWGLELLDNIPEEKVRELQRQGWNIVLYQLSHPETVQRYYTQKKRAIPDVEATVRKYIRATDGNVIWQNIMEDESCGVGLSQEFLTVKPKTHRQAYQLTENYFRRSIAATSFAGDLPLWAVAGFANTAHILARQPEIDMLTIERANDDVDDLQTGISFFRGAARQYGKQWGVDLSLWWGCIYGCVQDLPYLYHKRHLYVSWYSGAEHLRIEGSDLFFDRNTGKPTQIVKCLDDFGNFIKTHERGTPEIPVAVILPEDHGWITPPYWRTNNTVWNYAHIPYRQGQKALDGFFSSAYPGSNFYMDPFPLGKNKTENPPASPFALSCISQEFAPSPEDVYNAEYPVQFGQYENRSVARKELENNQVEVSDYRPMGNSRWGDILDVFTCGVEGKVLSQYKIIVLLDQIKLDSVMIRELKTAMNNGATVLCSTGVLTPEHADFAGAEIEPVLRVGTAWSFLGEKLVNEPFRYFRASLTDSKALATTSGGAPLMIEKQYGKGKLISCMIPWFEGAMPDLSNAALQMFDRVISEVQPVRIEGLPVEYLSTTTDNSYNVVLSNNSEKPWKGRIIVRSVAPELIKCKELLTNQPLKPVRKKSRETKVDIVIPPYEVRVISWYKN